jgi:uncharacterized protein
MGDKQARTWAMVCHLSALLGYIIPFGHILGPFVIWLLKKEEFPFVDEQGKEALNFQISMTIYLVVSGILMFVLIGFVLFPLVVLCQLIFTIIASVKANDGHLYRYPASVRFIK